MFGSKLAKKITKYCLIAALTFLLIVAVKYLPIRDGLKTILIWIDGLGFLGAIAFIIIYNIATILFIPGSILTMGGGAIFGIFCGSIYVLVAAFLGATIAFIIGRYLSRDWVFKQFEKHPKFQALDEAVVKEGFKIVFLTRLCPLFPFNLLNYGFGVMRVSLKDYILGSLGMIPGTVMYVYLGALAGDIALIGTAQQPTNWETELAKWAINSIGFLATVGVSVYLTKMAQKILNKKVS
mgnify:CR=1 FL=1